MKRIKEYWEKATPMVFREESWDYEQKRQFRYSLQDYMHDSFNFGKWRGRQVLEIGCGSGIDALEFARSGAIVTATDITDNAIQSTRELADQAFINVRTVQIDEAGHLPFNDWSFDCVYSFGVLHHIPNVKTIMNSIFRVLKRGGEFMGMVYNKNSLLFAYSILFRHGLKNSAIRTDEWGLVHLASKFSERNENCPYTRCYTKEEAAQLLINHGFKYVTVDVRYNVIDMEQQRKVKLPIDNSLELGWHLVIKGTKP